MTPWHSVAILDGLNKNELYGTAFAQDDSPWFSGHFPGDPILPGIAQLAMVFDALRQMDAGNRKIREIRRVRFKQVIKPGDLMELIITPGQDDSGCYCFKIMLKNGLACSGIMVVERS